MADNYLEKKMEQHKARAAVVPSARKCNLYSLLEHSVARGAFSSYVVREDQLVRIIGAAARLSSSLPFRFKILVDDGAAALRSSGCDIKANAYIVICSSGSATTDYLLLGRVVQAMLLQAAEIGLCCAFPAMESVAAADNILSSSYEPLAVLAFGRSAELSLSFESLPSDVSVEKLIIS